MIRGRHGRRLENCKNLNGIAIQIVYRRCGSAWLLFCFFNGARTRRAISLYLCLCPCLAKRTDVGINWFPRQTLIFEHIYAAVLDYAKHSQVIFPLRFLISKWSKPKNRGNRQKTGSYGHILAFCVPNFRETYFQSPCKRNWCMRRHNSSQVTFVDSIPNSVL